MFYFIEYGNDDRQHTHTTYKHDHHNHKFTHRAQTTRDAQTQSYRAISGETFKGNAHQVFLTVKNGD